MEERRTFGKNLDEIREINGQTIGEFAKMADIPKSTLQSIRHNGNTTIDTAVRISDALGLSLDSLVRDTHMPQQIDIVQHVLKSVNWFQTVSKPDQEELLRCFRKILEVLCK